MLAVTITNPGVYIAVTLIAFGLLIFALLWIAEKFDLALAPFCTCESDDDKHYLHCDLMQQPNSFPQKRKQFWFFYPLIVPKPWEHWFGLHDKCPAMVCKKAAAECNRLESELRMEEELLRQEERRGNSWS